MFTSPIPKSVSSLLFSLLVFLSLLAASVSATPVPAPGLALPLLSSASGSGSVVGSAANNNDNASPLALLDNLSSLSSSTPSIANAGPGAGAGAGSPLSLLGRVVAYRAPSVQKREHREREPEHTYERDADQEETQMLKRAERFQLRMMRRASA